MLLKMVLKAMKEPEGATKLIVADWLEENAKQVSELVYYLQLLRTGQPKVIDWLSIINKFGSGTERKYSQRIQRQVIKCRCLTAKKKKEVRKWFHDDKRYQGAAHKLILQDVITELENLAS